MVRISGFCCAMSLAERQAALLVLADGSVFHGYACGAAGTVIGEVVFNTGMTGYQEVLTDPSYCGQIVSFTYPELGNTGVNPEDEESARPQVSGLIARNVARRHSNWRADRSLPDYLQQHNIVGIYGIDTRALTQHLRSTGAMNGGISTTILDPEELWAEVKAAPSMEGLNLVDQVTTDRPYEWQTPTSQTWEFIEGPTTESLTVVAIDFGVKRNILRRLASYGCRVIVVPADTPIEEILRHEPDGVFLSNGPGDPATVKNGISTAQALLQTGLPLFGICLGHQILGSALGAQTFKLKFGHRGLNHPCGLSQQVEITGQNHGFAIAADSLGPDVEVTHLNLNDRTVAGLRHRHLPVFSVQYHPEASPGPHDSDYLFEQFVALMRDRQPTPVA
ncbi:carbamoyl-phosphate synthase small chain [Synechococcus elongatus PCC 6301]|uniref:Carbamoyl phosphate synthase small chain n=1 Tax=Synechococcus sp. (strain ATCC 27144 / PCC 6301 / SAUG 1402/1) TaxID=269084 RepID=CARA_SYNP6|nr:glutamine-hydrolyzing carbamoyl-phosphate synthase small subunit [Synechococcus elongatus]Q5N0L0.1 RecName: Full=Carbamoyl phosphate synthase small chain; AltName: Full=Carbamoyl phosphate synthetase glutamine chain [Synechococcus elongatus PCC 6301]BAD80160.1 carbamoyl-phosphate synthase small chain [Synechococcus elongatus PCC 6301]